MFQSENASAKAFFLSPYMKQWQKPSKMVSTNSCVIVFACRTSPIKRSLATLPIWRESDFPRTLLSYSFPLASARRGNCLPFLSWRLSSFVPGASRGLLGLGFSPSHVLRTGAKVLSSSKVQSHHPVQWPLVSGVIPSVRHSERASQDGDTLP